MTIPEKTEATPRFDAGAIVRACSEVTVRGFEGIPIGGWTGTVMRARAVGGRIISEVRWDQNTLQRMPDVFREQCERDGIDPGSTWLEEDHLEPDDGTPPPSEAQWDLDTPGLTEADRLQRIRAVLGLAEGDGIPRIRYRTLMPFYHHLIANLRFPFDVDCGNHDVRPFSSRRIFRPVTGLCEPEKGTTSIGYGLLCTILHEAEVHEIPLRDVGVDVDNPNYQFVTDYAYWANHWYYQGDESEPGEDEQWKLLWA